LTLREIRPEYVIPVGVWQIREGIRKALDGEAYQFDNFKKACVLIYPYLKVNGLEIVKCPRI